MGFFKDWIAFMSANAKEHMKRISIGIGAFICLLIISIPIALNDIANFIYVVYAGFTEVGLIIIMSIFGKNGNGNSTNNNAKSERKDSGLRQ